MTLTVARHERIEYQRKKYLPAAFARGFVCAECGGRIRLGIDGAYNVLSCYTDPRHDGFVPQSTFAARQAEERKAGMELETRRKDELRDAMKVLFPTLADALEEKEHQDNRGLLHPQEEGI